MTQPPEYPTGDPQQPAAQAPAQPYGQPYGHPFPPGTMLPTPTPQATRSAVLAALVALGVAVLVAIAAALPWVTVEAGPYSESVSGMSTVGGAKDGWITFSLALGAGIVALLAVLLRRRGLALASGIVSLVVGLLVLLTGIVDLADVKDLAANMNGSFITSSPGIGLWLTAVFGAVLAVCGLAQIVLSRRTPPSSGQQFA